MQVEFPPSDKLQEYEIGDLSISLEFSGSDIQVNPSALESVFKEKEVQLTIPIKSIKLSREGMLCLPYRTNRGFSGETWMCPCGKFVSVAGTDCDTT